MKKAFKEELDRLLQRAKFLEADLRANMQLGHLHTFAQIKAGGNLAQMVDSLCYSYFRISDLYKLDGNIDSAYEYGKLLFQTMVYYNSYKDENMLLGALNNISDLLITIRIKHPKKMKTEDLEVADFLRKEKKEIVGEYYLMLSSFAVGKFRDTGNPEAKKFANEFSEKALEHISENEDPLKMQFALSVNYETGVHDINNPWESIAEIEKVVKNVKRVIKNSTSEDGRNSARRFLINLKEGLANYYFNEGLLDQAIDNYEVVKKTREETNDIVGQISVSISLGNCKIQTGDYDGAITTCKSVLSVAESLDDWGSLAQLHRIIAAAKLNQNQRDEANNELELSENFLRKLKPGIGVLYLWLSFARIKRQGKMEYKSYYEETIKMARNLANREIIMQANLELGIALYQDNPKNKHVNMYFSEALKIARDQNNSKVASVATKYLNYLEKD